MSSDESNPLLGTVGAFIGSLLGVLAIVILGQLGYVAVVSGIVMGFGTFMGYALLGECLDKKGVIISIAIMILMIYFANRLNWAITVVRVVPDAGLLRAFFKLGDVIKAAGITSKYYESLLMDYVFCGIGAFSYVKQKKEE